MARKILGGAQDFAEIRQGGYFYIDKTAFIREWLDGSVGSDMVTLITRPRLFGKTMMLSTVEHFFSTEHAGRSDLFEDLEVWKHVKMREVQGKYPVIYLNMANVSSCDFDTQCQQLVMVVSDLFRKFKYIKPDTNYRSKSELFDKYLSGEFNASGASFAIYFLCELLSEKHGNDVILLIDCYDLPYLHALHGKCEKKVASMLRSFYTGTVKTNNYLERTIMTGYTKPYDLFILSDLPITADCDMTNSKYSSAFGFTEDEVFSAMHERGLTDLDAFRLMYDGYTFGGQTESIYNPWSVTSYLADPRLLPWWAETGSLRRIGKLIQEGDSGIKKDFELLLTDGSVTTRICKEIPFDSLSGNSAALYSLLLSGGYLNSRKTDKYGMHDVSCVNSETRTEFRKLVKSWFVQEDVHNFIRALMERDVHWINEYMGRIVADCYDRFGTKRPSGQEEPERFYHAFVLALLVALPETYTLITYPGSGYGRYDLMLEPRNPASDPAFILEFKVHEADIETGLKETVAAALKQIDEKGYEQGLLERGIPSENIHKYGFAFKGKKVLIG